MTFTFKTLPFKHQLEGFNILKDRDCGALLFECGLGKSRTIIDICRHKYYQAGQVLNTLIICPRTAMENWKNEWVKHSNSSEYVTILDGTANQRRLKLGKRPGIFIINFAGLAVLKDMLPKIDWDITIVDEQHNIKGYTSAQTRHAHQIADKSANRFGLTGTPILNSLMDVWGQWYFIDRGASFGNNFFSFRNKYFYDKNSGFKSKKGYFPNYQPYEWAVKEIGDKIKATSVFAYKWQCTDLPPKLYQELILDMPSEIRKAYDDMEDELIAFVEGSDDPTIASNALAKNIRLMQISSGFVKLDTSNEELVFKKNPKFDEIKELVKMLSPNHKLIIWCLFRNNIKNLFVELSEYNPITIFGDTRNPFQEAERFNNDPNVRVAICQPQTASEAINLTAASYCIYYSQDFSLKHRLQSEDRAHRYGSEQHDNITYIDLIYKDSVDENIVTALKNKEDLSNSVLQIVGRIKERRRKEKHDELG